MKWHPIEYLGNKLDGVIYYLLKEELEIHEQLTDRRVALVSMFFSGALCAAFLIGLFIILSSAITHFF